MARLLGRPGRAARLLSVVRGAGVRVRRVGGRSTGVEIPLTQAGYYRCLSRAGSRGASLATAYGEPPGRVGEAPSQRSSVSNGVASFSPVENDRPLAKECIPAVGRGIVQEPAVAVPEPVQTNTLAVDPHPCPISVGTPPRLEAPPGDVPVPIPDEYPADPRKCRPTDAHTSSRTQHVWRAVVTKERHVGLPGDALHDLHSIDVRARVNRVAADCRGRRARSETQHGERGGYPNPESRVERVHVYPMLQAKAITGSATSVFPSERARATRTVSPDAGRAFRCSECKRPRPGEDPADD